MRRRGDGESSFFSSDGSGSLPSHIRLSSAAGTSSGYISTLAANPATSCAVRPRWSLAPPDAPVASVLLWNWQEKGREEAEGDAESAATESAVVVDETPPPSSR